MIKVILSGPFSQPSTPLLPSSSASLNKKQKLKIETEIVLLDVVEKKRVQRSTKMSHNPSLSEEIYQRKINGPVLKKTHVADFRNLSPFMSSEARKKVFQCWHTFSVTGWERNSWHVFLHLTWHPRSLISIMIPESQLLPPI